MTLLGIISDTHELLRPEALDALRGSELIIHAGDVGKSEILERLRKIAPVVAVRGNVDTVPWTQELSETEIVEIGRHRIYILHDRSQLAVDPVRAGFAAVVSGHSHNPLIATHEGVLYLNPHLLQEFDPRILHGALQSRSDVDLPTSVARCGRGAVRCDTEPRSDSS